MRDAADASAVLMFRLPMLMMDPTPARRREAERMVREKTQAAMDGAAAASLEMWRIGMAAWLAPVAPEAAMRRISRAACAPARKTLRANARRLKARKTL